jgi:hypothetical protein
MGQSHKPKFKLVVENRDPIHFHSGTDAKRAYQQLDRSLTAMIMIRSKGKWENYMGREPEYSGTRLYKKHPFFKIGSPIDTDTNVLSNYNSTLGDGFL